MGNKIAISADGTCDLGKEILDRYNISPLYIYVNINGKSYRDMVDITPENVYDNYNKTGKLPTTSAGTVADYLDLFKGLLKDGSVVVHLSIGSGFSASYQNALIAASELEGVHVINTKQLSSGTGMLAIIASELAQKGASAAEIVSTINSMLDKVHTSFIIETLEFLHKGGRCSAVAALGANLLRLRPCIEVKDGAMRVGKKYRGQYTNVLVEYVQDKLYANRENINTDRIIVTHGGTSQENLDKVVDKIKSIIDFKEILVTRAGCVISSHCGYNTVGIIFLDK